MKRHSWKLLLAAWLGSALVWLVMYLLFLTCRKRIFGRTDYLQVKRAHGMRAVLGGWHRGLFFTIFHFRHERGPIMASRSKDGELVSGVLRRFGYLVPRGSSSRGGKEALAEFVDMISQGRSGGLAVDAPRGPAYDVKHGVIAAASRAEAPLYGFAWSASRCIRFKSWDRTILPLPFSTVVAAYDREPMLVPKDATREQLEATRREYEQKLRRLTYQVDQWHARGDRHLDPRDIDVPEGFSLT